MILNQHKGIFWMQFPGLLPATGVWHGIFLRLGGVSPEPYDGLNVSGANGDAGQHIATNRKRIADLLPPGRLHVAHQTHGTHVLRISANSGGGDHGGLTGDAMISRSKHQYLMIQVADCQAVLLADPVQSVVANIHSGWKGSVDNIIGNTIQAMVGHYHCRPEHILAGVGPSLGPCCAEFRHYREEIPRKFWPYKDSKDYFDFWAISRDQLVAAGVRKQNVQLSQVCTRCNPHLFFSYRARKHTGRFAAVIGLV